MQLADSAFPIGASSHSFGLETLTAEGILRASEIELFLADQLWEGGQVEARFVRLAYQAATLADEQDRTTYWLALNRAIGATKGARESRVASATLGRRFLQTVAHLEDDPLLQQYQQKATATAVDIHYAVAFGFVGGHLVLGEEETVLAYLQQMAMGLLSACLRLLPIGQGRTGEILWRLKEPLLAVAAASHASLPAISAGMAPDWQQFLVGISTFAPVVELASMRHPTLSTRLFVS